MTDKVQKIRKRVVEIVNSINPFIPDEDGKNNDYEAGKLDAATQILQIIDSLEEPSKFDAAIQEGDDVRYNDDLGCRVNLSQLKRVAKKEEPVSDDLEEAADCYKDIVTPEDVDDYEHAYFYETYTEYQIADAFKAGAKWKEEQFEKNRLKHCNSITNEQAELEQGFIDQHLDKHQRMPTFLDAIEYGMRLKEKQIMKNATEATVAVDAGGYPYIPQLELCDYEKDAPLAKEGDKYKVVLIKED